MASLIAVVPGCILSPPLVNEEVEQPQPPFIDLEQVRPRTIPYVANNEEIIDLAVNEAYDPNQEDQLYYAFFSDRLGTLDSGNIQLRRDASNAPIITNEVFFTYEGISYGFNPCALGLDGAESETVFFYLSDRNWESTGRSGVVPEDGAYTTSTSWVIDLTSAGCR